MTADQAAPLAGAVRKAGMLPVGVFRDAPVAVATEVSTRLNLHAVQLHGRENADYVDALRRELPPETEVWSAVSVGRHPLAGRGGDRILFDSADGGSGRAFDWSLVAEHPELERAIVGGGIGPSNARGAQAVGAFAIDVGSGVDALPGLKSSAKIAALFGALRPACRQAVRQCA